MEIVLIGFGVAFVLLVAYWTMQESDETKRRKQYAAARIARMQRGREIQAQFEYDRQREKSQAFATQCSAPTRSAPITTGKPTGSVPATRQRESGTKATTELNRRDNSFDEVLDTYTTPTYHSSHSSGGHSYSSHSCSSSSSSSSDSSSSSGDSGGGGCD
jgi:uncharacterized membrane protein YgcG